MAQARRVIGRYVATRETDVFVGLFRTAFIIALIIVPQVTIGPDIHPALTVMVIIAATFTMATFVVFLHGHMLPLQRPLSLLVDLSLITVAVHTVGEAGLALFQVYYLIVLIGAIWFQLIGAISVAGAALAFYIIAPLLLYPGQPLPAAPVIIADLGVRGGPFVLLLAIIAGYLVRTLNREQQATAQFEQELRLARTVQDSLLPDSLPQLPGYQVALRFQPARSVGGDLYNLERLPGGHYLLYLGDMPGKSVYGLVHLSLIHSHTRAAAIDSLSDPRTDNPVSEIAKTVNEDVYDALQPDGYAPLFIAILDTDNFTINFVNCGHPPPILLRKAEQYNITELATGGIVIGAEREAVYEQRRLEIEPGDILIGYTDGISEARNAKGEEFGWQRVAQAVSPIIERDGTVEQMAEAIISSATDFARVPGTDDATVIVFHRLSQSDDCQPDQ